MLSSDVVAPLVSTTQATVTAQPQAADSAALALQLVQVLGALGLIVGLIFALAWLARKKQGLLNRGMIKVIERISLGQKESLVLVRVNGETLLLGVTAGSVNLIKSLTMEPDSEAFDSDPGFAQQLAKVLAR